MAQVESGSTNRQDEGWGEVTEQGLERLLERVGVPRRSRGSMMRRDSSVDDGGRLVISRELNSRYARAIADMNPLYLDSAHAKKSIWQRTLVPYGVLAWTELVNGATDGFPGCHTIWRGCELQWERPVFVGEALEATTCLTGARLVDSKFGGGNAAVQDYETTSETGDGEVVGYYRTSWHRFSRGGAKKSSKYREVERPQWSDEDLEGVWEEYRAQNLTNRRGDEPLYWEDVDEGTEVPYIVKGPTTLTSKLAFESLGWPGGWVVGHELALAVMERNPNLAIRNEENVPEPPVSIHWTTERCQKYLGMPAAYEAGYERVNWLLQLLTAWCGDHGMPRSLKVRFSGFHWQGDVVRLHARVTEKVVEADRHLVRLDIETKTHRDETTTTGTATLQLPSRDGGPVWPPTEKDA